MLPETLLAIGLATMASALPHSQHTTTPISAQALIQVAPNTTSCANAAYPQECRPASIAAPAIAESFVAFNIHCFATQAALVAIMLFESGDFEYSVNHYPGVPGQGTRNMQSPAFNEKYAEWLATNRPDAGITTAAVDAAKAKGPAEVLALVNTDRWGFASAAWFLTTQCEAGIREGLAEGTEEGWKAYIEECVGTTLTEERTEGWEKVMALKHW